VTAGKDATITELLAWLRERAGNAFSVIDHWESDACAVGVSALDDPSQLVYISTYGRAAGFYTVQLETAPPRGSDQPFQTVGGFGPVTREELAGIVAKHLGISSNRTEPPDH